MNASRFAAGLYSTSAEASSVVGDWRLAGWTPKVLSLGDDLGRDVTASTLVALGRALGFRDPEATTRANLAERLAALPEATVLVWASGQRFADDQPAAWRALSDALEARTKRTPSFALVLAGRSRV